MAWAIVTGASTGIGRELAAECARDGYDVVLVARSDESLRVVADQLRSLTGRNTRTVSLDLSVPDSPRALVEELGPLADEVDVLVNNAGFGLLGQFWELSEEQQVSMVELNSTALVHLTRLFLPKMIARRHGFVLNVASTAAFQPGPLMAVYYATKAFVLSFSVAIHNEAARFGVGVTALCPGPTRTEFAERASMQKTRLFASGRAMTAAEVARIGYQAMRAKRSIVVTGKLNAVTALLTRAIPRGWAAAIARALQEAK